MPEHQRAEREERRQRLEDLVVAAGQHVRLQEALGENAERLGHAGLTQLVFAAHAEEQIVHRKGGDVIRRLAPFPTAAGGPRKLGALAEQDVPWMEVAVAAA